MPYNLQLNVFRDLCVWMLDITHPKTVKKKKKERLGLLNHSKQDYVTLLSPDTFTMFIHHVYKSYHSYEQLNKKTFPSLPHFSLFHSLGGLMLVSNGNGRKASSVIKIKPEEIGHYKLAFIRVKSSFGFFVQKSNGRNGIIVTINQLSRVVWATDEIAF